MRSTWPPRRAKKSASMRASTRYGAAYNRAQPLPDHAVSYYAHHVFFCCNQRTNGEACCADRGAQAMRDYAKSKVKSLALAGPGKVRINQAGCLDRCQEGPVIVVYPEEVWYTYVDKHDIDEIIEEHLINGRVVERLRI
jgi:(2Fe-2S) ferredoxin